MFIFCSPFPGIFFFNVFIYAFYSFFYGVRVLVYVFACIGEWQRLGYKILACPVLEGFGAERDGFFCHHGMGGVSLLWPRPLAKIHRSRGSGIKSQNGKTEGSKELLIGENFLESFQRMKGNTLFWSFFSFYRKVGWLRFGLLQGTCCMVSTDSPSSRLRIEHRFIFLDSLFF